MCELCCFSHAGGSSLRGISRISGLADDTVVSIVQAASQKAQMVITAKCKLLKLMLLVEMNFGHS
jgi:lambda repressor-like predicted transcriptional regulator